MPSREPITPDEAFDGLPDEIREAIETSGWQDKLRRAATARRLRVDQGAALEDETLRFMAGLQSVEEYAVHLAQEIPMPEKDFNLFVAELEREIFLPIQARLKEVLPGEDDGALPAAASVGAHEEDDLEALLNEGEDALARVAATAPAAKAAPLPVTPIIMPVVSLSAPLAPKVAVAPTPLVAAPQAPQASNLSAAAAMLAAPVSKPAEVVVGNLQRPAAVTPGDAFNPLASPKSSGGSSSDPYREPVL